MAIWLALIALIVVIVAAFYLKAGNVEGFGEFLNSQREYADNQRTYFFDKASKGIFTNPGVNLVGLNEAVAQPDLYLPKSPTDDMRRFFMEDPENAFKDEDNKMCRGATHPRNLPMRKPGDRLGCGWYFKESNDAMSVGALGTQDGPVIPTGLTGGRWVWNREEAIRLEDIKRCKTLRSCELLAFGDIGRECGFCFDKGHGVPINSNGSLKYPGNNDGMCGSKVITKAGECRPVRRGGAAAAGSVAGRGRGSAVIGGSSNGCINNGIVSESCLMMFLNWYGYDSIKGGLPKLITTRTPTAMTTSALNKLAEFGITIQPAFWQRRDLETVTNNLNMVVNISMISRKTDNSLESRAALFLVNGTPFEPCTTYTDNKRGPFDIDCLQQAFRKTGCQAGGAKYPNSRNAVSEFANLTWGQVNSMFKKLYGDMNSADPRTQDMALKNCLGAGSEFHRIKGETCWKCEDGLNVPIRRNAQGDIECASTNGFDCLWQSNKANCDAVITNMPSLRPLKCGDDHRRKHGGDGYSNPRHWCSIASEGGKHDGVANSWIDTAKAGKWVKIPGGLVTISISDDDSIWGTNAGNNIWRASKPSTSPDWRRMPGFGNQIDSSNIDTAYLIGTDGGLYMTGKTERKLAGGGVWISVGNDGALYHTNRIGNMYEWNGAGWTFVRGGVSQVAVGSKNNIWFVGTDMRPYKKSGSGWAVMPGGLSRVAVSSDGTKVVGVNSTGEIFAWDGSIWQKIPGGLSNISVNNNYIVGTNSNSEIFYLALN